MITIYCDFAIDSSGAVGISSDPLGLNETITAYAARVVDTTFMIKNRRTTGSNLTFTNNNGVLIVMNSWGGPWGLDSMEAKFINDSLLKIYNAAFGTSTGKLTVEAQADIINCHINIGTMSLLKICNVYGCTVKAAELIKCSFSKESTFYDCAMDFPGFDTSYEGAIYQDGSELQSVSLNMQDNLDKSGISITLQDGSGV